jgi:hypothetical protein
MVSGALLIAAFVHAIVILVRGNAVGGVALIIGTMLSFLLAFCSLMASTSARVRALSHQRESARQTVAAQPLDLNSQSALVRGPDLIKTVNARVKAIDLQLRDLRTATGRPEDVDRRAALLAERKSLTGE